MGRYLWAASDAPLNRTQDLVCALQYVGFGLSSLKDDSAPAILGLAEAPTANIDALKSALALAFAKG